MKPPPIYEQNITVFSNLKSALSNLTQRMLYDLHVLKNNEVKSMPRELKDDF